MTNVTKRSLLTLIELLPPVKRKPRMGLYQCECGNITKAREGEVRALKILSCGCWSSKRQRELHLTHGLSKHLLYGIWKAMIDRCENPDNKQYPDYGGLGITVYEEWRGGENFINFFNWAMEAGWETGLHLDKDILSKKLGLAIPKYSPETCCFITRRKNNRNKKDVTIVEYEGQKIPLPELCEKFGISNVLVRGRMKKYKWDLIKALTTPKDAHKHKKDG
jgi:hypothetical protein